MKPQANTFSKYCK